MNIGENIKKTRDLKGLSQIELSEIADIPRISLGRYERNERDINTETLNKLTKALKVNTSILLEWTDNIVTGLDLTDFLKNLYPIDLYDYKYDNVINILKNSFEDDSSSVAGLYMGIHSDKKACCRIGKLLGLTDEQIQIMILSISIDDFIVIASSNINSNELIEEIIRANIVEPQPIDDLIDYGLSYENKEIINNYAINRSDKIYTTFERDSTRKRIFDELESVSNFKKLIKIDGLDDLPQKAIDEINDHIEFIKHKYSKKE